LVDRTSDEEFAAVESQLRVYVLGEYRWRALAHCTKRYVCLSRIYRQPFVCHSFVGFSGGPVGIRTAKLGRRKLAARHTGSDHRFTQRQKINLTARRDSQPQCEEPAKSRTNAAISSAAVSKAKWPPSTTWTCAVGTSLR